MNLHVFGPPAPDGIATDSNVNISNIGTVNITVAPVNDAPTATAGTATVAEDGSVVITLHGGDLETLEAGLLFSIAVNPTRGTLDTGNLAALHQVTYTPNHDYNGPDSFTFTVTDGGDGASPALTSTPPARIRITVTPVNDAPEATSVAVSLNEDTSITSSVGGTDADLDRLTYAVDQGPGHGTLILSAIGTFVYTADANFNGVDTFTFIANDGTNNSAPGTVTVNVIPVNDRPIATADNTPAVDEDDAAGIAIVLSGTDLETAAADMTYAIVTGPLHGTLTPDPVDGRKFTYVPAPNFFGIDSFTFTATDRGDADNVGPSPAMASTPATVSITVSGVDDPPDAEDGAFTTWEDTVLHGATTVVNVDADALTYSISANAALGTAVLSNDGTFVYTPHHNANGTDGFTFRVQDGNGNFDEATVTIVIQAVNDEPAVADSTAVVVEDGLVVIPMNGNDPETPLANLLFTVEGAPAHGSLTIVGNQATYVPTADYAGPDSFTFVVTDQGTGGPPDVPLTSRAATVSISVAPVNDAPTASGADVSVNEDGVLLIPLSASDVETGINSMIYEIAAMPLHGIVSVSGRYATYRPSANYNGPDSFTFKVTDRGDPDGVGTSPALTSAAATVNITVNPVNDRPVVTSSVANLDEDASVSVVLGGGDYETPGGLLVAQLAVLPLHGAVVLMGNTALYTPAPNYYGADSFTFTVTDGGDPDGVGTSPALTSLPATVTINVAAVEDAPTASNATFNVDEDGSLTAALPASDPDNLPGLPVVQTIIPSVVPGQGVQHGVLTFDGLNFTYTPTADWSGTDTFQFTINDGDQDSAVATVSIVVAPVNDRPTVSNTSGVTNEDTSVQITLSGSDIETAAGNLAFAVVTAPAHGGVIIVGNVATYTPDANYSGPDSFTFAAVDRGDPDGVATSPILTSLPATVDITVNPVNDRPVANNQSRALNEDSSLHITLTGSDIETASGNLAFAIATQPSHGTVTINGAVATYVPTGDYNGPDSFTFTTTDTGDGASPALTSLPGTVSLTVAPVNDAPTVFGNSGFGIQDEPLLLHLQAQDVEDAINDLTFHIVTQPQFGQLTDLGGGQFRYTPNAAYYGVDCFEFTVTDRGDGASPPITSEPARFDLLIARKIIIRANQPATFFNTQSTQMTVRMTGPGTTELHVAPTIPASSGRTIYDVIVTGTTSASTLTFTSTKPIVLDNVTVQSSLSSFLAPMAVLRGDFTVWGTLSTLTLDDVAADHHIDIATTVPQGSIGTASISITMDRVADTVLDTNFLPIRLLKVTEWMQADRDGGDAVADSITAPRIDSLTVAGYVSTTTPSDGNFQADIDLTGSTSAYALGTVSIKGAVTGEWDVRGNVKSVTALGSIDDWALTTTLDAPTRKGTVDLLSLGDIADADIRVADILKTATVQRWTDGLLRAAQVNTFTVAGRLASTGRAAIPADFGADVTVTGLGGTLPAFGNATINHDLNGGLWQITGRMAKLDVKNIADGVNLHVTGSIDLLKFAKVTDSNFMAGVNLGAVAADQETPVEANFASLTAKIKSIQVIGITGNLGRFVTDAHFSAPLIGTVTLKNASAVDGAWFAVVNVASALTSISHTDTVDRLSTWTWTPLKPLPVANATITLL